MYSDLDVDLYSALTTAGTPYQVIVLGSEGAYLELWQAGKKVASKVPVIDWGYTDDSSSDTRRSMTATIPLSKLLPDTAVVGTNRKYGDGKYGDVTYGDTRRQIWVGLLLPYATQARLFWTGTVNGVEHVVPLGRFTIGVPSYSDEGTVAITGMDASSDVSSALLTSVYRVPDDTGIDTALANFLRNRLPGCNVVTDATNTETNGALVYVPGSCPQPWQIAQDLAALAGWELWCDRDGSFIAMVPPNEHTSTPSIAFEFHDDTNIIDATETPSAAAICNTVIVYGQSAGSDPVFASASDATGPFGTQTIGRTIAVEVHSDTARTVPQCAAVASVQLRRNTRPTRTVVLHSAVPVPHLDSGDLVTIVSQELELTGELFIITAIDGSGDVSTPWTVTCSRTETA